MSEQEERFGDASAVFDCLKYHAAAGDEYEYRGKMAIEAFDRICTSLLDLQADRDALKAKAEWYCSIVDKIINVSGKRGAITGVEVQDILRAALQEDTP